MSSMRYLKLVLCITENDTLRHFQALLENLTTSHTLPTGVPGYRIEAIQCETPSQSMHCVRQHLGGSQNNAAILVFDTNGVRTPSDRGSGELQAPKWAKDICEEMRPNYATIAIMQNPERLPDIDRVIGANADSRELFTVLNLVTDKINYTAKPEARFLENLPEIRLIRKPYELLECFKLRYRVYKVMGYLEADVESSASQMEIDWCDKISLQFGAFAGNRDRRDTLVGTARVVITSAGFNSAKALLNCYRQSIDALVEQDPALQQSLEKGMLLFQLPIFHSQKLGHILREVLRCGDVCGELSRVIVVENYRGLGLSTRLVEFALAEARKSGINRMFLECLVLHERLYEKLGFRRIPGAPGTVISVNQTMIGMELRRPPSPTFESAGGGITATEVPTVC